MHIYLLVSLLALLAEYFNNLFTRAEFYVLKLQKNKRKNDLNNFNNKKKDFNN